LVSLYRLSQRGIPAVIAILAILMLFLAPEVSKNLAQWPTEAPETHQMHNSVAHEMAADHHSSSSAKDPPAHHAHHGESGGHHMMGSTSMEGDFACGYCELLIHCPLIFWLFTPLIWLLLISSRAPPIRLYSLSPIPYFAGCAQPRAPPVI